MTRLVVIGVNNDGGHAAVIVESVDGARQHIINLCMDCDPPLDDDELSHMSTDLELIDPAQVSQVRGSEAWKEVFYVAPLAEASP